MFFMEYVNFSWDIDDMIQRALPEIGAGRLYESGAFVSNISSNIH